MTTKKLTKLLALYLPYILLGLVTTNLGEVWRLAEGKELGDKIMAMMGTFPVAFANPLPSLHPLDLLIGFSCGAGLRLAVYLRSKNAKKYRHGMEYGSARWGNAKDIEPFMAPKFSDNIILTKTERLMMSNRPPDPKNARNKNVLVVGGSGSGKTRFWLKPNLLQCHSSYVVTDPKGGIIGSERMRHRIVRMMAGNVRPLGHHSSRDGKARGRIIFAPSAQVAHHGKQDHAQHKQKHQREQDAEQRVKPTIKHFNPPKFPPAAALRPPEKRPRRGCSP